MKILTTQHFSINVGTGQIALFSFEGTEAFTLTIQSRNTAPVAIVFEEEFKPNYKTEHMPLSNSEGITIVSLASLDELEHLHLSIKAVVDDFKVNSTRWENKFFKDDYYEDSQLHYNEGSSRNSSHYNDNLDMDQQSQEYWDNL